MPCRTISRFIERPSGRMTSATVRPYRSVSRGADRDRLAERQLGGRLFGPAAEVLAGLRGVDAVEAVSSTVLPVDGAGRRVPRGLAGTLSDCRPSVAGYSLRLIIEPETPARRSSHLLPVPPPLADRLLPRRSKRMVLQRPPVHRGDASPPGKTLRLHSWAWEEASLYPLRTDPRGRGQPPRETPNSPTEPRILVRVSPRSGTTGGHP